MFLVFGTIDGTDLYERTGTAFSVNFGMRLTFLISVMRAAIFKIFGSVQGRPRISIPIGTPIGASSVAGENPAGIVTTGNPVTAPRIPFLPDWDGEPTLTTRFFCSGYMIASRSLVLKVVFNVRIRFWIVRCLLK